VAFIRQKQFLRVFGTRFSRTYDTHFFAYNTHELSTLSPLNLTQVFLVRTIYTKKKNTFGV